MSKKHVNITKYSGEKELFSKDHLKASLRRSGADETTIENVATLVASELYEGITTKEIYNRAFALLKKKKSHFASKYKLKKAIFELGPTGFPFEQFVSEIFNHNGYTCEVSRFIDGKCVTHEIDVVAKKNNTTTLIECKFKSEQGGTCDVKIPLYIQSRYQDIKFKWNTEEGDLQSALIVTNARFTKDAEVYAKCEGLNLMSWDFPAGQALKDKIDRLHLYPITVSTLLTQREKQFLLSRNMVLCRQLLGDKFYLDHLGVSEMRKTKILNEIKALCHVN
jgi:hypothetical protein